MTAPVQPWRWIRLEIGLIANGGIQYALFINHPLFWPALGLTSLLWLLLMLWPVAAPAAAADNSSQDADKHVLYWRSVANHVCALLPLWAGHIALSREQIDEAAAQLTERFEGMLRQIENGEDAAPEAPSASTPPLPPSNALESLRQLSLSWSEALGGLHELDKPAIAEHAQSLLRELAALEHALSSGQGGHALQQSLEFRTSIEQVLFYLQFQDRVNQILSHVQNDIWQLEATLHDALHSEGPLPEPPDTESWLNSLKSSYTTHEQRALHNREENSRTPGQSDITFF
ncbi:hypothetical protein [Chromobacterium sp. IIBBL 290-4]|uniref:hypothetical protein n=1 Tax=Chromobacterium sp. IIBBL 290-4 TaxID=2953890 RepID=UPI0020B7A560|nr:hypothetical protein [Chromobacterium sp. IIBBL 290-4]UTH75043.1 hypothetical protein NKT35_02770 [Chromobacterium sp. IIBBL 290-4]